MNSCARPGTGIEIRAFIVMKEISPNLAHKAWMHNALLRRLQLFLILHEKIDSRAHGYVDGAFFEDLHHRSEL